MAGLSPASQYILLAIIRGSTQVALADEGHAHCWLELLFDRPGVG
jgi:hypothetical protein